MSAKRTQQTGGATFHLTGQVRSHADALAGFRREHPDWLDRWAADDAVYSLPQKAIVGLQSSVAAGRPLLEEDEAEVELAFTELCRGNRALGYWMGGFVTSALLVRPDPLPPNADLGGPPLNWSRAQILRARQLVTQTDSLALRLRGYMGWLVTDPQFARSRDELMRQWFALSPADRPFPIGPSVRTAPPEGAEPASREAVPFQRALDEFLKRWGLLRMITWDLPEPQGPMLPAPLSADAPAMPTHGLHIVLPLHYPLTETDDLLRQIRQQQLSLAQQADLDPSMAGLPHFEVYARMFEVNLLERIIRSREPTPRRGFVTAMEHVIAEVVGRSVHRVQRLRKDISACRRGRRSSVPWLQSSR